MAGFSLKLKYATQWVTLVAATLAVLGGIVGLGVFAQYYFANQQELRYTSCINFHKTNLLTTQIVTGNIYARYINTKVNLLELREKSDDSSEHAKERIIAEEKLERLWKELIESRDEAIELAKLEDEKCSQPSGALIWPAS